MNASDFEQMMLGFSLGDLTDNIGSCVDYFKSVGDDEINFGDVVMTGHAAALFAAGMFAMGTVVSGCIEHGDAPAIGNSDEEAIMWVLDVMETSTLHMMGVA